MSHSTAVDLQSLVASLAEMSPDVQLLPLAMIMFDHAHDLHYISLLTFFDITLLVICRTLLHLWLGWRLVYSCLPLTMLILVFHMGTHSWLH